MNRGRARIRVDLATTDADPAVLAEALAPDNTAEMDARLDGTILETHVERASAGGLQSTIDDYLLNLGVAIRVARLAAGGEDSIDDRDDPDGPDGSDRDAEDDGSERIEGQAGSADGRTEEDAWGSSMARNDRNNTGGDAGTL